MRSEQERDQCIDGLMARIQDLEADVARLKDVIEPALSPLDEVRSPEVKHMELKSRELQPADEHPPAPTGSGYDSSRRIVIPDAERPKPPIKPTDTSLENAIGTRWIGRIGIVAILFGVAFFLKYSFDNKLIGETGRIILGLIWGTAFLAIGEYLQKKKNLGLYGQLLSGGGLAVFYLSLYAAFALYHLLPAPLAAAGMLAVTTTGMTLSVRYSAYSLAAVALLGGFLTPIMLATGQNQPIALFGYILLLDVGTLVLLRFRPWPSLVAASLCGTALIYLGWHSEFYSDAQRLLALGIITVFFIFYNLSVILSRPAENRDVFQFDPFIVLASAALYFLAFFAQEHLRTDWPIKIFTLSLAAVEIILAFFTRWGTDRERLTVVTYAVVSVILTVVATFLILEQRWIMPALAAEMVALGWIGLRMKIPIMRGAAYVIGLLVLVRFAHDAAIQLAPFQSFTPVLNSRFFVCAFAIAAFYGLLYTLTRYRDRLDKSEEFMPGCVFILTQLLSLILLSIEVYDYFRFQSLRQTMDWIHGPYAYQVSLSVLWSVYASVLIGAGIFRRLQAARIFGILLLGLTVLKVFLMDLSELRTLYRIFSFIVLGLLLLVVAYCYNRFKHLIFGEDEP